MCSKTRKKGQKKVTTLCVVFYVCTHLFFVESMEAVSQQKCANDECNCVAIENVYDDFIELKCQQLNNLETFTATINRFAENTSLNAINVSNSSSDVLIALSEVSNGVKLQLKRLQLSDNHLRMVPLKSLVDFRNIESLDLSNNQISEIDSLFSASLKHLNISYNLFENITFLPNFPQLELLDLSHNKIKNLTKHSFQHSMNSNLTIDLSYNGPWFCDRQLIHLFDDNRKKLKKKMSFRCSAPWNLQGMSLIQAKSVLNTKICEKCDCFLVKKHKSMAVNCTATDLKSLPQNLPIDTRIVNLTDNHIEYLTISETATNWQNVSIIYLSNNSISSFNGFEGKKILKSLGLLSIRNNKLEEIPKHILQQLSSIDELYLGKNPYLCNCNTVTFREWLHKHSEQVKDINSIKCNGSPPISAIPKSVLCPQPKNLIEYLDILSFTLAVLTILILAKLMYDWFWQKRTGKLPLFFKINH